MSTYVQANRPLTVSTPLGKDVLLLTGLRVTEGISQLFSVRLDLIAENRVEIAFDRLLGQKLSVKVLMPGDQERYFHGFCRAFSQGERDRTFTRYEAELVPDFWKLTRIARSRIFQHLSVPDILKQVVKGFDVSWEIQGSFEQRDYCVQYRETDFNFASRLMEE